MGAYHTIDIQLNQRLTLAKLQWDIVALDRLGEHYIGMYSNRLVLLNRIVM